MSVQEIEAAIAQLPRHEWSELSRWFEEFHNQMWDEQIERDAKAGRFYALIEQVKAQYAAGEMTTATQTKPESRRQVGDSPEDKAQRPIWETVTEIGEQISDAKWEKVPDDSSVNYKRHLYGAPAKSA